MRTYFYKAYDEAGRKHSGMIDARHSDVAGEALSSKGLRPYFVIEYGKLKKEAHRRKWWQKKILLAGAIAIALAGVFSLALSVYANREKAPGLEEYTRSGLVTGASGIISAKTDEDRKLGLEVFRLWNETCPNGISGLEVKRTLVTVYVTSDIHNLTQQGIELLATNTARFCHRHLGGTASTLLVVEQNDTILEVNYSPVTGVTRVKAY